MIKFDSNADDGIMEDGDEPAGDGTYMVRYHSHFFIL